MKYWLMVSLCAALCLGARAESTFFVFDNGLTDIKSVKEQAALLRRLGYDGICSRPGIATSEMLTAFDKQGVDLSASYVVVDANGKELPGEIVKHVEALKGRDTIIWLALKDEKASDEKAVATIRKVYDLAKENGLDVVLYSHVKFRTDTIERTEHLRKLAGRPNLGISFNVCHFLAQTDPAKLEETIKSIAPHLKLVLLSGANVPTSPKADWSQLILPLGDGDFEMERVFRTLEEIGYRGSFGLQCYKVPGPAEEHLSKSINAWRAYNEQP